MRLGGARLTAYGDDAVFAALADPTRRRLLDQLSAEGPRSATELAPGYAISRQAVVKHLGTLADAGLVVPERSGRAVRYRVSSTSMAEAAAWITEVGARWERRLESLRAALEPER